MKFELNRVYTFKLNSGEEMIAKVVAQDNNLLTVSDPVSIAPGPQGMGLVPAMFTADITKSVMLNIENVSICAFTDDSVCNKYLEATTGIKVPDKKLILG